jgi:hypothetical protein
MLVAVVAALSADCRADGNGLLGVATAIYVVVVLAGGGLLRRPRPYVKHNQPVAGVIVMKGEFIVVSYRLMMHDFLTICLSRKVSVC